MKKNSRLSIWLNRYTIILYLLLGGALLVRIIGLDWNLPHSMLAPNEFDEYYTVKIALRVLRGRSLNPGSFMWPSLYFYVQAFAYGNYSFWMLLMGSLQSLNDLTIRQVYLVGRFTTVLFGVGNVLLVYLIAKRMYSKKVGLLAALFLSFSLLHIRYSRVIRPDIPMAFLVTLSFLFIYLIYQKGKTRDYVLAAIFTGLSAGTKYTGIILIAVIFLAHLLHTVDSKKGVAKIFLDKRLFLVVGLVVLTFFLTTPYGLVQFAKLQRTVVGWSSGGLSTVTANQPAEVNSWLYYITHSLDHGLGYPLAIFSLAAIVYLIFTHRKKDILLISFPLLYYFIIGSFTRHGDRYILSIIPFLAIIAAMFLMRIVPRIPLSRSRRSVVLAIAVFVLILFPGIKVIRYVQLMSEKGTRLEAKDWVNENIPRGKRIAYEFFFPHFSGYGMENIYTIGIHPFEWYKDRFDYIIVNSGRYERYFKTDLRQYQGIRRNYEDIEIKGELVKQFDPSPFSPNNPNPTVKIYKVK